MSSHVGEGRAWDFYVQADEKYRYRFAPDQDETDQDLSLFLDGGTVDPTDRFAADLSLGVWWDLDGTGDSGGTSTFSSPYDTGDSAVWLDVHKLSAEYRDSKTLKLARAGRQVSEYGQIFTFDGATLVLKPWAPYLQVYLFGGRSVHFFEIDQKIFEDLFVTGGVEIRPTKDVRLDLDYRFAKEDTTEEEDLHENTVGFKGWFRHDDWLDLQGSMRVLNGEAAFVGGAARFDWAKRGIGAELSARVQLVTLRELTEVEDPYYSILGESLPHVRFDAHVWKQFSTEAGIYMIDLGFEGRQLTADDPTPFNRNFSRAYGLATGRDIFLKGLFLSLVLDWGATDLSSDSDGDWALGGSVGYESKAFRAEVGTYYQQFNYDYYLDVEEKTNVRTLFGDVRKELRQWLSIYGRYEFERFDRDIHTATMGLTQKF
jgi:opacity protein-like surface antigen